MPDALGKTQGERKSFQLSSEQKAALRGYASYVVDDKWNDFAAELESIIVLYLVPEVIRAPAPSTTAEIAERTAAFVEFLLKDPHAAAFVASRTISGGCAAHFENLLQKIRARAKRLAKRAARATRNGGLTTKESKVVFGVNLPQTPRNRAADEGGKDFIDNLIFLVKDYGGAPAEADFVRLALMCWRFAGKLIHSDRAMQTRVKRRVRDLHRQK